MSQVKTASEAPFCLFSFTSCSPLLLFHVQIASRQRLVTFETRDLPYLLSWTIDENHMKIKTRRMRFGAVLSFVEVRADVLDKDVFWGNEGEHLNVN